jgi:predicted secreted protein
MGPISGIVVFLIIWSAVLFITLPFGVTRQDDGPAGSDPGAPKFPYLKWKFLATTIITAIIWIGVDYMITHDAIDFQKMADRLEYPREASDGEGWE